MVTVLRKLGQGVTYVTNTMSEQTKAALHLHARYANSGNTALCITIWKLPLWMCPMGLLSLPVQSGGAAKVLIQVANIFCEYI